MKFRFWCKNRSKKSIKNQDKNDKNFGLGLAQNHLQADVLVLTPKLNPISLTPFRDWSVFVTKNIQNTCRQTFWACYNMFHYVTRVLGVSKTPAGRRFEQVAGCCIMCLLSPKHLQADVLSSFHVQNTCRQTFWACYSVFHNVPVVLKTPAGRRFEQVTACSVVCLVCPKHLQADVLSRLQHVS